MSYQELAALILELPEESATGCALRGRDQELEGWSLERVLLGGVLDAVRAQWSEKRLESVLPKALQAEANRAPEAPKEIQPDSAAIGMLMMPSNRFVETHGR